MTAVTSRAASLLYPDAVFQGPATERNRQAALPPTRGADVCATLRMSVNIGLDIGAVSLKLAAIGAPGDAELFQSLAQKNDSFFAGHFPAASAWAGRPLLLSRYRRIQGSPIQSTFDLLKEFYECVPEQAVEGIRVTGSGSQLIAKILGIYFENEFRAIAKGVRVFYPEVRTVFEMGGEASKYLRLEPGEESKYLGIVDYDRAESAPRARARSSTSRLRGCCTRWRKWARRPASASCAARIAGRCSVFAKTDMIHAQQKGYTTDRDPARAVRRGGAQLQVQHRQGPRGRSAGGLHRRLSR